jgi:adenylate cyclase
MYSGWINKAYSKIDPVLTLNQKTDVSLFAGRESDEVLRLFMGNRGDVDMLIMGEDRQYFYQNYVLENKIPKNWFFLRSNLKESMKKHLYRKTLNWNKLNQEIIFGLVHKNYPEVDYIYPAPEAEVGSKIFKRFERHAGKIIDIAGMTSARIFEYDDQNLVFVYPCRKAGDFILAAIITFRDLKQRSFVRELLLGIILILLSIPVLMISGFMVKYLVLPLKEVEQGLKKIGEEDFSSRMRIRRQDELGELAMAFDGMMDGIIERKNLGRFVSANLDTRVSDENSSLTGKLEKNFAAVLCSDIRSFTTLSEEHEAREIVEMLNGHLSQMSGCIREHEGKVEQFIGDAVLAIFFGETDHKAVSNALDAARAMMSIHKKNIEQRKSMGKFFFDIGIGIEADHIISGALKLDEKSEYVLVGKARYMAEELEGKSRFAKHSRIICSDNVKQLALNYKFEQLKDTEHWELINGENDS